MPIHKSIDDLTIDLVVHEGGWPDQAELLSLVEKSIAVAVDIAELKLPPHAELSVVLSNDEHVQILNRDWRQIDKPTNVLSFPTRDIEPGEIPEMLLGDIILARETIAEEAVNFGISFADHLTHLVIHGFLHIFGYDHVEDKDAEVMERLERQCLRKINIPDPYSPEVDGHSPYNE